MSDNTLATIEQALDAYREGRMVIIVDDEDRENEGDFAMAAEFADEEAVNFMVTHGRGLVCAPMHPDMLDRLELPLMVPKDQNRSGFGTGFTVSVEATVGVTTGISAADRAKTIQTLIDPTTKPSDLATPGHMFPLRANANGVLARRGQTEASVDLSILAGLKPAAVICEVMEENGEMMRLPALCELAKKYNMPVISVEALAQYRLQLNAKNNTATQGESTENVSDVSPVTEPALVKVGSSHLPTAHGTFDIHVYRDAQGLEHSALVMGDVVKKTPLVRMHSECLTGDAFGSLRCDCGEQLQRSMALIAENGSGVLVYLRQEGRGIGLGNKIRAYALQDEGLDTVDANQQLGFAADARSYGAAADMLKSLNVKAIDLLTNNPDKVSALRALDITIDNVLPLEVGMHEHNAHYLQTKAVRMGHTLPQTANEPFTETNDKHKAS